MGDRTSISPEAGFSQAVRDGHLVVVSGQVAWGPNGDVFGLDDARVQADQAFSNLRDVLVKAGADLGDVVKLTCYLVDARHFEGYSAAKAAVYPDAGPASTTVVVSALLDPRLLLEVEAIAVIP